MQICPELEYLDQAILLATTSMLASSKMMAGDFPPSSRVTGVLFVRKVSKRSGRRRRGLASKDSQVLSSGAGDDPTNVSGSGVEDVVPLELQ